MNFIRYQIIQRLVYQNSPVLMLAWRGSILWLTNRYGPYLMVPHYMVHIIWSYIIWSVSYDTFPWTLTIWTISYGPYHLDHIWTISYVPYLFVSLHFLMFYLCIATTGCIYITSQWLLLWYSESLLESENVSDLKVASKSKRRPCRKIEE